VISEPFGDLPGAWHEIPPSTAIVVHRGGRHESRRFTASA
jgi:hypothetical protein